MISEDILVEIADYWRDARRVMVLTGAGISTESGLPDFRSAQGLWTKAPANLFSIEMLEEDPKEFYAFYRDWIEKLDAVKPNDGHIGLAGLMQGGQIATLATQNIDGLHQAAGARDVLELHGTLRRISCLDCGQSYDSRKVLEHPAELWLCPQCGGKLRPDVVMFGEMLPEEAWTRAGKDALQADLFVVVGSSLTVAPANMLPEWALSRGAKLLIVNRDATPLDRRAAWAVRESAGEVIRAIAERVIRES